MVEEEEDDEDEDDEDDDEDDEDMDLDEENEMDEENEIIEEVRFGNDWVNFTHELVKPALHTFFLTHERFKANFTRVFLCEFYTRIQQANFTQL